MITVVEALCFQPMRWMNWRSLRSNHHHRIRNPEIKQNGISITPSLVKFLRNLRKWSGWIAILKLKNLFNRQRPVLFLKLFCICSTVHIQNISKHLYMIRQQLSLLSLVFAVFVWSVILILRLESKTSARLFQASSPEPNLAKLHSKVSWQMAGLIKARVTKTIQSVTPLWFHAYGLSREQSFVSVLLYAAYHWCTP